MAKRFMLILMALTVLVSFTMPDTADAARRGGFKSGKGGFTQTPKKQTDNVQKSEPAKNTGAATGTTGGTTGSRGFFSGGSFVKGMMIGGLAGLLFGSMFAGMGFFGDLLGLMINLLAIYLLVVLVAAVWHRIKNRQRRIDDERRRY